jgi:hypothetical protein
MGTNGNITLYDHSSGSAHLIADVAVTVST